MMFMVTIDAGVECPEDDGSATAHDCNSTRTYIVSAVSQDAAARKVRDKRQQDGCTLPSVYHVFDTRVDSLFEVSDGGSSSNDEDDVGILYDMFEDRCVDISVP